MHASRYAWVFLVLLHRIFGNMYFARWRLAGFYPLRGRESDRVMEEKKLFLFCLKSILMQSITRRQKSLCRRIISSIQGYKASIHCSTKSVSYHVSSATFTGGSLPASLSVFPSFFPSMSITWVLERMYDIWSLIFFMSFLSLVLIDIDFSFFLIPWSGFASFSPLSFFLIVIVILLFSFLACFPPKHTATW